MYRIGFFILLAINIGLVILFVTGPKPPLHEEGIKDGISSELGFTKEQKAKFDQMAINHREAIRDLEVREQELVRTLFAQLSSADTTINNKTLLDELLQLESDKITITYNHFEELKGICSTEQLTRFDRVVQRILPILTNSSGKPMKPEGRPPF